jgi:predicted 2-oxoglutarate/Fe(II)-dependent dioxygenase YbiX
MSLVLGDRMPFCAAVAADQRFYSFDAQAGRAAILVLAAAVSPERLAPIVEALVARRGEVSALGADLVVLRGYAAGPQAWTSGPGAAAGLTVALCPDAFLHACGVSGEAVRLVVIDRASVVLATWAAEGADPDGLALAALSAVRRCGGEAGDAHASPAPILALPALLDEALCRELIDRFDAAPTFDSGIAGLGPDGRPNHRLDPAKKRRRDWLVEPGDEIYGRIMERLARRCAPDIKRAFQHDVAHIDRLLVARYDDSGGYFHRHRDNAGEATAFRQFALSVNLNTGEYEGGDLVFPEYNDHRYRPGVGCGVVFSASLLHAATPVTQGARYVLLTFLHDEAAERLRLAIEAPAPAAEPVG